MSCDHNCDSCSDKCESGIKKEKTNMYSQVKKTYAVISGKGGVGKSLVTSLMAVSGMRLGLKVGILDADITGPSIPKLFGATDKAQGSEEGIFPVISKKGVEIMSVNSLLENDSDPVVWRGPVIAGTVKQFYTDVIWNELDVMFIDCPPGTGDVPLTIFQSIPIDGVIVVTSPQDLVSMIVAKAVKMAGLMNIPVVGMVENMSYFECPKCGEKHYIYGESKIEKVAKEYNVKYIKSLPIKPEIASACDKGLIELVEDSYFEDFVSSLVK